MFPRVFRSASGLLRSRRLGFCSREPKEEGSADSNFERRTRYFEAQTEKILNSFPLFGGYSIKRPSSNLLESFNLSFETQNRLRINGHSSLRPLEAQSYHSVYMGENVLILKDESSKFSFPFALPLVEKLRKFNMLKKADGQRPYILVMTMNSNLIFPLFYSFSELKNSRSEFHVAILKSQLRLEEEQQSLKKGAEIVIANPQSAYQHIRDGFLSLDELRTVIVMDMDPNFNSLKLANVERVLNAIKMHAKESNRAINSIQYLLLISKMRGFFFNLISNYMNRRFGFINALSDSLKKVEPRASPTLAKVVYNSFDQRFDVLNRILKTYAKPGLHIMLVMKNKSEFQLSKKFPMYHRLEEKSVEAEDEEASRFWTNNLDEKKISIHTVIGDNSQKDALPETDVVIYTFAPRNTDVFMHRASSVMNEARPGLCVVMQWAYENNSMFEIECKWPFETEKIDLNQLEELTHEEVISEPEFSSESADSTSANLNK